MARGRGQGRGAKARQNDQEPERCASWLTSSDDGVLVHATEAEARAAYTGDGYLARVVLGPGRTMPNAPIVLDDDNVDVLLRITQECGSGPDDILSLQAVEDELCALRAQIKSAEAKVEDVRKVARVLAGAIYLLQGVRADVTTDARTANDWLARLHVRLGLPALCLHPGQAHELQDGRCWRCRAEREQRPVT